MPHSSSPEEQLPENDSVSLKLLLLYASHQTYFDSASRYLDSLSNHPEKESISREDIDRLYLHIAVLKSVEKMLREQLKNR